MALPSPQGPPRVPIEPWRLWLGRIVLIPLGAMSAGMIFALYKVLASGVIHVSSKGYRPVGHDYSFADSPFLFLFFFALYAVLAGLIILVTVFLARRVIDGTRPG